MRPRYAKRQSIAAIPSANGVNGSKTAGDPSVTQLVIDTRTGLDTSRTERPEFAPGFVSIYLALI